eukprot:4234522-Lingulodinium_polyedra.AAC.1
MNNPIVLKNFVHQFNHGSPNGQRTIDCLDMFAGRGAVSKAFAALGFNAASFGIATDPSCDLT